MKGHLIKTHRNSMDMELSGSQMEQSILVNGVKDEQKVMEFSNIQMVILMMVKSKISKLMVKGRSNIKMDNSSSENGSMISKKEKV